MALDYARYLRAQDPVWTYVVAELTLGVKQTHWMWFVFPQLRGLGTSEMSQFFGLESLADARDYCAHPMLCERLETACSLVLGHSDKSVETIFGKTDAQKLRSSMTLFAATPAFADCASEVLDTFFEGKPCPLTWPRLTKTTDVVAE